MSRIILASAALLGAGFALAACGPSDVEKAELVTCREIVKLQLDKPKSFKVAQSTFDETSEGEAVILEVDFSDAAGVTQHVRERCWFAGYGDDKALTQLSVEKDNEFVAVPDADLEAYKKQLSG